VRDLRATVFVALQFTGLLVVPLWWAANLREQRTLGEVMAAQARADAVQAERSAMARELHDVVASHLSSTAIHSAAALALPPDAGRDRAALREVRASSLAALDEMRTMITVLRAGGDDALVPAGLAQLPQALASARGYGLAVDAEVRPVELPSTVDQAAFRIVSEALTNARKHAPGARVTVRVGPVDGRLHVTVRNTVERPGRAAGLGSGTGLASMRERAALAGGTLEAGRDGGGWRVHAELPLPGAAP
jgi:signal transduction histidine kinase